ncbi:hypothetical protein CVD28_04225 [Bacillus sp. M6-12]|uniref:hypothetical protein n=1 Tax=Bacillus sp. M6-12 TaxID=2054166 RepID=UPI000C76384A|nr:hypothetical protein [Bacillus sp. M6-12]PLS19631.1 hypothetical protein CVD28_04225 [Bacillus sp. M6-12]
MSFSYNEELVFESNSVVENLVAQIDKARIIDTIKAMALQNISVNKLKEEFEGICPFSEINGEYIKNYFVIGCNGIQLLWNKMKSEEALLQSCQSEPLYENVFTYFDCLVDEINFDSLFVKELLLLN